MNDLNGWLQLLLVAPAGLAFLFIYDAMSTSYPFSKYHEDEKNEWGKNSFFFIIGYCVIVYIIEKFIIFIDLPSYFIVIFTYSLFIGFVYLLKKY